MTSRSSTYLFRRLAVLFASVLAIVTVNGQAASPPQGVPAPPAQKQVMADDVYKNLQELKGITAAELWDTMGFIAAATGFNCVGCHVNESLISMDKFAEDTPRKRRARQMIAMTRTINKTQFGGAQIVTCNTCHNGQNRPVAIPSLLAQYSLPEEDPNAVETVAGTTGPSATDIFAKYLQALGGVEHVRALTSVAAKGTYSGYDTYNLPVPYEVYAKAPNQRTVIVHTQNGDNTTTLNGQVGWVAAVDKPTPLMPATPPQLAGMKFDTDVTFPANISRALNQWRTGYPVTAVGDKDANVVEGTGAAGTRTKLFFDAKSGLLLRSVRFTNTVIGTVPVQTDYEEYKDVAGVQIPVKLTVTWTSGQAKIVLTDVQANVAIDAAKFAEPAPAVLKRRGAGQ